MIGTGLYSGTSAMVGASAKYSPALIPTAQTSRARSAIDPLFRFVPTPIASPVSLIPSSSSSFFAPRMIPSTDAAVAQMQSVSYPQARPSRMVSRKSPPPYSSAIRMNPRF